jgi:hypothetical protein
MFNSKFILHHLNILDLEEIEIDLKECDSS